MNIFGGKGSEPVFSILSLVSEPWCPEACLWQHGFGSIALQGSSLLSEKWKTWKAVSGSKK